MNAATPAGRNGVLGHVREHYVAYALALMLAGWTEMRTDDRFTGRMGERVEERIRNVEDRLQLLPPRELLERVARLEIKHEKYEALSTENQRQWRQIEELQRERVRLETLLQSTVNRVLENQNDVHDRSLLK